MRFLSTRGASPEVSLRDALGSGLAPDGGLYVPARLEPLAPEAVETLLEASREEIAGRLASHLLGDDLEAGALRQIVETSLTFPVPLVRIEEGIHCLELFWGPTLAFKDVGARFMAQLMLHFRKAQDEELTILVATSGDTGAAVAHAFHGLDGFRVEVLFPERQVSEAQKKLFTTLNGNVSSLAIDGSFDDCQRLVKQAFADTDLRRVRPLASANSINVGRLLPQIFYYFCAMSQLPHNHGAAVISTPSGNFGNLTAGLMAKRLGLPVARFVAATNVNDTVPRYLETGTVDPRPSVSTISNAMDVGDPSNLSRIRYLYGDDIAALRRDLVGSHHTDDEVQRTMQQIYHASGYVLDPHSAVGYLGLRTVGEILPDGCGVFLATAHPAKFKEIVEPTIGHAIETPAVLAECLDKPERFTPLSTEYEEFRDYLS